jgi:hypothetical protein
MKKTNDYDIFKFREDNREKISQPHVEKLVRSISSKNLLDLKPILVNEKMEILDGQHRVLAAKKLGVDVYYDIKKEIDSYDIILLNTSKEWRLEDYLNYYCKNGYKEYQIFNEFIKANKVSIKIGLAIACCKSREKIELFRAGKFVFIGGELSVRIDLCWSTIKYIKEMNGFSPYTGSTRFWSALIKMFNHPDFNFKAWTKNLEKMVNRVSNKISEKDYLSLFQDIYNWKRTEKINLF